MIIRMEEANSTIELMFDLMWDEYFSTIHLENDVRPFPEVKCCYTYGNLEARVLIEICDCQLTNLDRIELSNKINHAQLRGWKVYVIASHQIEERYLKGIANDTINRSRAAQVSK